ncbi:hypothetical protein C1646_753232 [Rhizophagus diaphanus]|nr:hypothetical protein C1646_753232 [Rhizophagus diaphanus] [Rhizophagus sp. MUCL 43196]
MLFANIRISKGSRVLHAWYIHPIPYEITIKEFFVKLVLTKELSPECGINIAASEVIEHVELSETPVSTATRVSPDCGIIELTSSRGPGKANHKQTLCCNLVDWIHLHNGGWSTQSLTDTQGKQFIVGLVETIWYIDMCNHEKLKEPVTVKVYKKNIWVTPVDKTKYNYLKSLLIDLPSWKLVDIEEYLLNDPVELQTGVPHYYTRSSAPKVDEHVKLTLELGDPEITIDLHEHESSRSSKYDTFWKIAAQFLIGKAADAVTAVDERKYDTVMHLATAILVNDLLYQIKHLAIHWSIAFKVYGLNIPTMSFPSGFGELEFFIAAVERGKKVVVSKDITFAVVDHDFTKTGIIPSVAMIYMQYT